jgi:hypothetical protein
MQFDIVFIVSLKFIQGPSLVTNAYNPSTLEAQERVLSSPGLSRETLSQKKPTNKTNQEKLSMVKLSGT